MLEELPNYFDLLAKLTHFNVNNNKLSALPDSLKIIFNRNFKL